MSTFVGLPDEITLSLGEVSARVSPEGASLTELTVLGKTVIEHVSAQAASQSFAGATLAPWPNRLKDGEWVYEGKKLRFENLDDLNNANHGLVFNRTFEVETNTGSTVVFRLNLGEDAGYPFRVQLKVEYALSVSGVTSSIKVENLGSETAPIAFGAHPYIAVDDECEITITAETQAVNDERMIPIAFEPASKNKNANGSPLRFGGLQIDDCFGGLARDPEGISSCVVRRSSGDQITVWQDEAFKYLMVYAHHSLNELGMSASGLALEPQTSPANALQSGTDLYLLQPGKTKVANWGITFELAN